MKKSMYSLKMVKVKYILLTLGLVILILLIFLYSKKKTYRVILEKDGFSPKELKINKGDVVIFTTNTGKLFWPASNLHPTHDIYPEFDPKHPIETNKNWQFQFDKIGRWRFHDHLAPLFSGEIIVGDIGSSSKDCDKYSSRKIICWENQILEKLNKEGMDSAFELISNLYSSEPSFAQDCHGILHKLGHEAYKKFLIQKDFKLSPNTSYCEFGFYHGFMEALIQDGRKLSFAREFCANAKKQFKNSTIIEDSCYHGIGHGFTDGSDSSAYGDPQALINPALKLCKEIGDTDFQRQTCATGVFNSLAKMYRDAKYRLYVEGGNPYRICYKQTEKYFKSSCFGQMNTLNLYLSEGDFSKAVRLVDNIQSDKYAQIAINHLASIAELGANQSDQIKFIDACHKIRQSLRNHCISGLGKGLVNHGQPKLEYVEAIKLCEMKIITEEEKDFCFSSLFHDFDLLYSRSKNAEICRGLIKENQKYCKEYMVL